MKQYRTGQQHGKHTAVTSSVVRARVVKKHLSFLLNTQYVHSVPEEQQAPSTYIYGVLDIPSSRAHWLLIRHYLVWLKHALYEAKGLMLTNGWLGWSDWLRVGIRVVIHSYTTVIKSYLVYSYSTVTDHFFELVVTLPLTFYRRYCCVNSQTFTKLTVFPMKHIIYHTLYI